MFCSILAAFSFVISVSGKLDDFFDDVIFQQNLFNFQLQSRCNYLGLHLSASTTFVLVVDVLRDVFMLES